MLLVDQPAEQVPPANLSRTDPSWASRVCSGRYEAHGAMRSLPVVVRGMGPERPVEMPSTEDERPVEALGPDRLDHALGVSVGVRSLDGRHDHPGPFRANNLVELPAERRVPVSNEEPDGARASVEVHDEVARLLGHPRCVGMSR